MRIRARIGCTGFYGDADPVHKNRAVGNFTFSRTAFF